MREGGEGLRAFGGILRFFCFGVLLLKEDAPMEKAGDTDAEGLTASLNMMSTVFSLLVLSIAMAQEMSP